jgi:hypothetical protein
MRLHWRRLRRGELDHELIWLAVSVAAALLAGAWLALRLPWPRCTFLALTGLPCFTCGATRAGIAFLSGDFVAAWQFNPLVFVSLCGVVLFDLYAVAVLVGRLPRLRVSLSQRRVGRVLAAVLLSAAALNWAYLLVKY